MQKIKHKKKGKIYAFFLFLKEASFLEMLQAFTL